MDEKINLNKKHKNKYNNIVINFFYIIMDEIKDEKKSENEGEKSKNSIKNEEIKDKEINEEIKEKTANENEIKNETHNTNNENSEIINDKIENNISEIKNKIEENDSLLQKEINEIKSNQKHEANKNKKVEIFNRNKDSLLSTSKSKQSKKLSIIDKSNYEEIIYSHNHYHNENILKYIKQKELKEIEECSFRPKINKKIGFEVRKFDNEDENGETSSKNKDVVERLLLWKERVKQKLNEVKDKKEKEELERDKFTFIPKLKTEIPKFDKKEISGTEKYYDRIKNSRELKKRKENILNPNYDELYKKHYKSKEKAVLKNNKKISKKTYENYLNHFHNVLMNDDD